MGFWYERWFQVPLGTGTRGLLLAVLLLAGLIGVVRARPDIITDNDLENTATTNGTVDPDEYSGFTVGINTGAGDIIGSGSKIYVDAGGAEETVHFGFVPGISLNNFVVVYIDSVDGGFSSTESLTDDGDFYGRAVSAAGGTDLHFAPSFYADYAISFTSLSAYLFELPDDGSIVNVKPLTLELADDDITFELDFLMSDVGLSEGGTFKYLITLVYPQHAPVIRFNEFHGVSQNTYTDPENWDGGNSTTKSFSLYEGDYNVFSAAGTTRVGLLSTEASSPGPSASVLLWPLLLALLTAPLLLRRRRRRWE